MYKEKTQRQKRINKRIQRIIAETFAQSDFEVAGKKVFITITRVDISPDLRNVSIFLNIAEISSEDKEVFIKELNKIEYIKTIRKIIAKDLDLRVTPNPLFKLDRYQEKQEKISSLIEEEAKKFKTDK